MQAVDAGTHEGNKIELLQQRLQIRQLSHMPSIAVYRLRRRVHGARASVPACEMERAAKACARACM